MSHHLNTAFAGSFYDICYKKVTSVCVWAVFASAQEETGSAVKKWGDGGWCLGDRGVSQMTCSDGKWIKEEENMLTT